MLYFFIRPYINPDSNEKTRDVTVAVQYSIQKNASPGFQPHLFPSAVCVLT